MKNAASFKSKTESPKTPGGISKALLTPCRRVGLSRNWRKSASSPFQSPLSSREVRQEVEKVEKKPKKRKNVCEEPESSQDIEKEVEISTLTVEVSTPVKNVELPHRKKSKTLLTSLNNTSENSERNCEQTRNEKENKITDAIGNIANIEIEHEITVTEPISTPMRLKSKNKSYKKSPISNRFANKTSECTNNNIDFNIETTNHKNEGLGSKHTKVERSEVKSPNNLTKECIVVIQKKIFKEELKDNQIKEIQPNTKSQILFDSDSDDIPLCQINKEENQAVQEDNDFEIVRKGNSKKSTLTFKLKKTNSKPQIERIPQNFQISDEEDKNIEKPIKETLISKPKKTYSKSQNLEIQNQGCQNSDEDQKLEKLKKETTLKPKKINSTVQNLDIKTQNFLNSDDDDFVEQKRTIVIKKSYDKPKLIKAKSTGSITQKDIEELKMRIEKKKKLLLAKAMTEDTKELRELIKKWQKGCQDALMELMNLMKNKMPDKNMDYSEMLKALKIPAHLVGYDSENDIFCTPDDESIILTHLGD